MAAHDDTEKMEHALEVAAREFAKHSGPSSDERERRTFGRDLRTAALRFARAYYAEARELGLIPEYERAASSGPTPCRMCGTPDHKASDAVCVRDDS